VADPTDGAESPGDGSPEGAQGDGADPGAVAAPSAPAARAPTISAAALLPDYPQIERRNALILGTSGFGKSYLTKILLTGMRRYIVVEQRPEYDGLGLRFYDFDEMVDYCFATPDFRAIWAGGQDYADNVFHLALGLTSCTVVLEEADIVPCEPGSWFYQTVYRGRVPAKVSIFSLSQRPHLISPHPRSQMTDCFCFQITEPGSLEWLKIPFGRDLVKEISQLPPKFGFHRGISPTGPTIQRIQLP